jgi:hypothetical protein
MQGRRPSTGEPRRAWGEPLAAAPGMPRAGRAGCHAGQAAGRAALATAGRAGHAGCRGRAEGRRAACRAGHCKWAGRAPRAAPGCHGWTRKGVRGSSAAMGLAPGCGQAGPAQLMKRKGWGRRRKAHLDGRAHIRQNGGAASARRRGKGCEGGALVGCGAVHGHDAPHISPRWLGRTPLASGPHQQAKAADRLAPHAAAVLGTAHVRTRAVGAGEPLGWTVEAPCSWVAARRRAAGPRGGEQRLAGRGCQIGPSRERREMGEKWVGGLRRGAKRPTGDGRGVSYFLFSSKLLLNEYFTKTKQTHKNRCVTQHDATT